jgi:ethanolamine ammonia-lyase large subunit
MGYNRSEFLKKSGLGSIALLLSPYLKALPNFNFSFFGLAPKIDTPKSDEDIFSYITRKKGKYDITLYRQIIGAANPFKEGDLTLNIAAHDDSSRTNARKLIEQTTIEAIYTHSLFTDELYTLINNTCDKRQYNKIKNWTLGELKTFILTKEEKKIKAIMSGLSSDVIGCLVKLLSNEELIQIGQKVFNPLPNSNIGAKGYLSARVQPNSPTDNVDDIVWQVFSAWSYAVGDLVLGTNPVSSTVKPVANIEAALFDVITTFGLEDTLPNCVLSHIDVQADVEEIQPDTTGIWFQSLAGTVNANETFDVSIEKMFSHAAKRTGKYGLYAETGQGADFTNGHGEGFDMVVHEARKYGFLRALKQEIAKGKTPNEIPWVHVNDVAGFIGPEVFKTKEQLVRTCLEDTIMGKLHGLPIGLDICSTLHMDITLNDLDWCIDQIMPANPTYLMALPTKNDPMLSYLSTAFNDHIRIREKFGYKVNDKMWDFFKRINIIDENNKPTEHFGDPYWVYYQYRLAKKDSRSKANIYAEGKKKVAEITKRGVPITQGFGKNIWDLEPKLDKQVRELYKDAKVSLWTEMPQKFVQSIPSYVAITTTSTDKKDYVYHPESGEELNTVSITKLQQLKKSWKTIPDVQIVISDGLNARALMDDGHLEPHLKALRNELNNAGLKVSKENIVIHYGRVRAGYRCGEILFSSNIESKKPKGILHIIGERPGSGHHNFSVYISAPPTKTWSTKGKVDHNITKVISGISDTALPPTVAAKEVTTLFSEMFKGS